MGKQVYVVTAGSYSDYGIVGVFDDRELAELAAENTRDANDVEVYDLNPNEDNLRAGLKTFIVEITKDGTVCDAMIAGGGGRTYFVLDSRVDSGMILQTGTWARNEKHAIKIANERRAYLLAENLWPEAGIRWPGIIDFPWERGGNHE